MIAPADFPPHPTKGRIMLDGYHNCLMWEGSRDVLTEEERLQADYRKSIASYAAPWNPKVGQKWLDLKTNKVMLYRGGTKWWYDDQYFPTLSEIPVDNASNRSWSEPAYPMQSYDSTPVVLVKAAPKPVPEEQEPPKKSRVFTLK